LLSDKWYIAADAGLILYDGNLFLALFAHLDRFDLYILLAIYRNHFCIHIHYSISIAP
jgi:hypothetical protein